MKKTGVAWVENFNVGDTIVTNYFPVPIGTKRKGTQVAEIVCVGPDFILIYSDDWYTQFLGHSGRSAFYKDRTTPDQFGHWYVYDNKSILGKTDTKKIGLIEVHPEYEGLFE